MKKGYKMFFDKVMLSFKVLIMFIMSCAMVDAKGTASKDLQLVPHNESHLVELDLRIEKQVKGVQHPLIEEKDLTLMFGEKVTFSMRASKTGYASLWHIDSSGAIQRLFPNPHQTDMKVTAGKTYRLGGGADYFIQASEPVGLDTIYMLWTKNKADQPIPYTSKGLSIVPQQSGEPGYHVTDLASLLALDDKKWVTTNLIFETVAEQHDATNAGFTIEKGIKKLRMTGLNKKSRIHVLSMGANTRGLSKADKDARKFSQAVKHLFSDYKVYNTLLPAVTLKQFRAGMNHLKKQARPQDWVIIFFSGHGSTVTDKNGDEKDKRDEVFVTTDANQDEYIDDSMVMVDDEFARHIKAIKTNNIIIVIDACHAGGMTKSFSVNNRIKAFRRGVMGAYPPGFDDAIKGGIDFNKGVAIFAASEQQQALETLRGGLLTTFLLDQMNDKKNIGANWLSIITQANRKVRERSKKLTPFIVGKTELLKKIKLTESLP